MITIKEISNILGVSTTTVSNVINGKTKEVSKQTIDKVENLIKKYDYVPNINAKNLATNNSNIIGVCINFMNSRYENIINDPFVSELLGAIEKKIRYNGYFMMLYIADDISEILKCVTTWNVDGLVFLGINNSDLRKIKQKYKKPVVYIDSYFYDEVRDFVNIGLNDTEGAYNMTKYLIECGHRKIAFFSDNLEGLTYQRFIGYKKALLEYKIDFNAEDAIIIKRQSGNQTEMLNTVYKLSEKYTALFCTSDYYAVNIINYMIDMGKSIPDDISIAGFDNTLYSKISRPALTTVHQDIYAKGELSVEYLIRMIQGEDIKEKLLILPTKLIIRDTVKILN